MAISRGMAQQASLQRRGATRAQRMQQQQQRDLVRVNQPIQSGLQRFQSGPLRLQRQQQRDLARVTDSIRQGLQRFQSGPERLERQRQQELARVSLVPDLFRVTDLEGLQRVGTTPEMFAQSNTTLLDSLLGLDSLTGANSPFGVPEVFSTVPQHKLQILASLLGG